MYWTRLDEKSTFLYLPELEPVFAAYDIMRGESVHGLSEAVYGAERIAAWRRKYRFLFETYECIKSASMLGLLELLLDYPLEGFTLDAFLTYVENMPVREFVCRYMDWRFDKAVLENAVTDDESLAAAYRLVEEYCPSFLGFSTIVRQSERYKRELFAFISELDTDALRERAAGCEKKALAMRDGLAADVLALGPFECSQKNMGKQFHSRGPYDEFFFLPSLFLPGRAIRFFHTSGAFKRQILFLSLEIKKRGSDDTLRALKALADGTRYRIMLLLAENMPLCGLDIANKLSLAPSTVSHHMEQLRECGLVTEENAKGAKYYGVSRTAMTALLTELNKSFSLEK